jgi:hypothetical protein
MPIRPQKKLGVIRHDGQSSDVFVTVSGQLGERTRYSVLIPNTATRSDFFSAAVDLAIWVRHRHPEVDTFVPGELFQQSRRVLRTFAPRMPPPDLPARDLDDYRNRPEPGALRRAELLLQQLDPDLHSKMSSGKAFYFTTKEHRYIWYPNQTAILDLAPDAPRYVCIHSRDRSVEENKWDWAITMRTYLLAREDHLRAKANFHHEYHLRGPIDAHHSSDIHPSPAEDPNGTVGDEQQ